MILKCVLGKIQDFDVQGKKIEYVRLTWEEMAKRILRKTTSEGREVGISLDAPLQHEDVLYAGKETIIVIELLPTRSLVLNPRSMQEMAILCYHLGNRHANLFYQDGQIVTPYDHILEEFLVKLGFSVTIEERRLSCAIHTSSAHHHH
ncbi:MAG: urease accessory protein UreE [Dethiobacter sp.]|nr:urease accessory protein UreE [Dethiobacter sp.]MBS4007878.1 urease accessory protein UreE [Clostridium sp.]MDA8229391.1 urease accessory protein UreE [Desulfitobacterium hafniense]